MDTERLMALAKQYRKDVLTMTHQAKSGHIGGSLSVIEILTYLYHQEMQVSPAAFSQLRHDRLILSKGHAAPALYAVLADCGFFGKEQLATLRQFGSNLQGHPSREHCPGVELSTGSLGMGISAGLGMALGLKLQGVPSRVFVVCGDGELNEGQNWEAMMAAAKWNPENLTVVVDHNHVQLDGTNDEVMPLGSLQEKIRAFGLEAYTCDGHDFASLAAAFASARAYEGTAVVLAETVKGKGVSFMEGQHSWHGKRISDAEYSAAMREMDGGEIDG